MPSDKPRLIGYFTKRIHTKAALWAQATSISKSEMVVNAIKLLISVHPAKYQELEEIAISNNRPVFDEAIQIFQDAIDQKISSNKILK